MQKKLLDTPNSCLSSLFSRIIIWSSGFIFVNTFEKTIISRYSTACYREPSKYYIDYSF
jgi:hypothetical protein